MKLLTIQVYDVMMNAIKAIIASIVVMDIILVTIIDELTSLEKMIVTVQFDMTGA